MPVYSTPKDTSESPAKALSQLNFQFLCDTVYRDSGIVLDESKGYLLEARLLPIVRAEEANTLDGLCNLIRATGGRRVRDMVVEAMTTNETLFFRDARPFEGLEKAVIPELTGKAPAGRLRVWCAACSSGQEPYSLAMLWKEMAIAGWDLDLLATDLSDRMIEKAASGHFSQLEVNRGLPAKYLVKYFTRQGTDWQIKPELQHMVNWRKLNLKDRFTGLGPFDIVLCRNVLIYFDTKTKKQILAGIRALLVSGGYLALGASETTLNIDDNYLRKPVGPAVMYQKP